MCQAALAAIGVGAARQTSSRFRHLNGCSNSRQARGAPCREWTLCTALLQRPILESEIKSIRVGTLRCFLRCRGGHSGGQERSPGGGRSSLFWIRSAGRASRSVYAQLRQEQKLLARRIVVNSF